MLRAHSTASSDAGLSLCQQVYLIDSKGNGAYGNLLPVLWAIAAFVPEHRVQLSVALLHVDQHQHCHALWTQHRCVHGRSDKTSNAAQTILHHALQEWCSQAVQCRQVNHSAYSQECGAVQGYYAMHQES